MPLANVKYVDPTPLFGSDGQRQQHWSKVEGPFQSFELLDRTRNIEDISGKESQFQIDTCGFAVHHWPLQDGTFANEEVIRSEYYPQVEELLRQKLPGNVKKIVIFDHTLRSVEAEDLLRGRYSLINVWRPIGNLFFIPPALDLRVWRSIKVRSRFVSEDQHSLSVRRVKGAVRHHTASLSSFAPTTNVIYLGIFHYGRPPYDNVHPPPK